MFFEKYEVQELKERIKTLSSMLNIEFDAMTAISKFYTEVFGDFAYIFPEKFEYYLLNVFSDKLTIKEVDILIMRFISDASIQELSHLIDKNEVETEKELLSIERKCRTDFRYSYFTKHILISVEKEKNFIFRPYTLEDLQRVDAEKESERKIKFNIEFTVEELDLSVRAYNCLKRAGYNEDIDFEGKTVEDLRNIRNMNSKSLNEIVEKLEQFGILLD